MTESIIQNNFPKNLISVVYKFITPPHTSVFLSNLRRKCFRDSISETWRWAEHSWVSWSLDWYNWTHAIPQQKGSQLTWFTIILDLNQQLTQILYTGIDHTTDIYAWT